MKLQSGKFSRLSKNERAIFRTLSTPIKIQDFLDKMPSNFEKSGETLMSPRAALAANKAHCIEGALIAATALWLHGQKPLLLDLRSHKKDFDHVVALYKINGLWGAISKTNHATLNFRDPIFKTIRELALSYFHEYFFDDASVLPLGKKTLEEYSGAFDLSRFGDDWICSEENLWDIGAALDDSPHFPIVPAKNKHHIRNASAIEIAAGKITRWKK